MGEGGIKSVLRLFLSYNYFSFIKFEAMVTDQLIKKTFIHNVVSVGFQKIRQIQQEVISENLNVVSGNLLRSIQKEPVGIIETERQVYYMSVLPYMRFLDIYFRENIILRRNLSIYNRVVWGVIYGEVLPNLRYGFTQDIRKYITRQLQEGSDIDQLDFQSYI
jgi:hypothetical protein|nr:MAG: hypothetical protein [Bacteriophage sp.]